MQNEVSGPQQCSVCVVSKLFVVLIAGLLSCCCHTTTAQPVPAPSPQRQGNWSCRVSGFSFRPNVVPSVAVRPAAAAGTAQQSVVQLFSLPFRQDTRHDSVKVGLPPKPLASLRATAAACRADAACGMWTSDGYLVGAYRTSSDQQAAAASSSKAPDTEADIISWQPMHYCTRSACCGTWVSNGLMTQLLRPVSTSSSSKGLAQLVLEARVNELPRDSAWQYTLKPSLLSTTCAAAAAGSQSSSSSTTSLSGSSSSSSSSNTTASSTACPDRCLVACCRQLAAGDYSMGPHHFSQCSGSVCRRCGFAGRVVAAAAVEQVLVRQYLRERWRRDARAGAASAAESRG